MKFFSGLRHLAGVVLIEMVDRSAAVDVQLQNRNGRRKLLATCSRLTPCRRKLIELQRMPRQDPRTVSAAAPMAKSACRIARRSGSRASASARENGTRQGTRGKQIRTFNILNIISDVLPGAGGKSDSRRDSVLATPADRFAHAAPVNRPHAAQQISCAREVCCGPGSR